MNPKRLLLLSAICCTLLIVAWVMGAWEGKGSWAAAAAPVPQTTTPNVTLTPSHVPTCTLSPTNSPTSTPTPTATDTSTSTPTSTLTPTPTNTPISTLTPTSTPTITLTPTGTPPTFTPTYTPTNTWTVTRTPTGACSQCYRIVASGSSRSCSAPDAYSYNFWFQYNCNPPPPYIPAHHYVYFEVGEGSGGPWIEYDNVDYRGDARSASGTMHEGNIPSNYQWYRFRLVTVRCPPSSIDAQTSFDAETEPDRICGTQVTLTPTNTPTPTSTPTFSACLQSITEGFESGTLGMFASSGSPGWSTVTGNAHSGAYAAYAPDVGYVSDQQLTLNNPITIPLNTSQATISFWQSYDFDAQGPTAWDGGVLETSVNGGPWNDAPIISGGYTGVLVSCPSLNPLASRQAWVGSSEGWVQVSVDLTPYRGMSVRFRFREGTSDTVGGEGWWIDDVAVSFTQGFCWTPTTTATPPTITATRTATPIITPTLTPSPSSTPCGPLGWVEYPGMGRGILNDVAVAGPDDMWAVGFANMSLTRTLIRHWDGENWSVVSSPNVGTSHNILNAVAVAGPDDIWAVGHYGGPPRTLITHWDGTEWAIVPSPNVGTVSNYLHDLAVLSPNDVWAVGEYRNTGGTGSLALHWNGIEWSVVPSPNAAYFGVDGLAADDVWAGGYGMFHWDGSSWSEVPTPSIPGVSYSGVEAISSNDVWAVGAQQVICGVGCSNYYPITIHWDGISWTQVAVPGAQGHDHLLSVAAQSSNDIHAVGYRLTSDNRYLAYIVHWDGSSWSEVSRGDRGLLTSVTVATPDDWWAVGFQLVHPRLEPPTIAMRYSLLPLFNDVPPTDPFYTYIQWLACRGVISGYSDGTFRPYNNTTRGQLTKIITLAEGWPIYTPPTPNFSDVPATPARRDLRLL
jgi:hypothetical protein